jgi:hypothetical protein
VRRLGNMDWIYYEPRCSEEYSVRVFDDGNERYAGYVNVWHKYGEWRGKIAIVNSVDRTVRLESISEWKLDLRIIRNAPNCENGADAGGG